jgi:hypothetical protein
MFTHTLFARIPVPAMTIGIRLPVAIRPDIHLRDRGAAYIQIVGRSRFHCQRLSDRVYCAGIPDLRSRLTSPEPTAGPRDSVSHKDGPGQFPLR